MRGSYAAPYQELLHSGGKTAWTTSGPVVPATGLPMITGTPGLGLEGAEMLSRMDKKEFSRGGGSVRGRFGSAGSADSACERHDEGSAGGVLHEGVPEEPADADFREEDARERLG